MNPFALPILAALNIDLPNRNRGFGKEPGLILSDVLLIAGVGLLLLLVLGTAIYVWMRLRRRRRRHISGGEKVYRDSNQHEGEADEAPEAALSESDDEDDADDTSDHHEHPHHHHRSRHGKRRYKYRVRRRTHRTRNPTLSETGGLPPVKTHEPGTPG
ncbi:MAG: hypothetical protein AB9869_35900 [Verrucomicrobiia bacterium]